jgi:Uma2 family endonuclease
MPQRSSRILSRPRQASPLKLTYGDYVALPDDGLQHEIIEGEHFVTGTPMLNHQRVVALVSFSLMAHVKAGRLGEMLFAPVDVVLSPHDVVQPDVLYLSSATLAVALATTPRFVPLPPDLVVEVLSPSTWRKDLDIKRRLYERTGVPEYWLVDPDLTTVTVYRSTNPTSARYAPAIELSADNDDVLETPQLPGWSMLLSELRL